MNFLLCYRSTLSVWILIAGGSIMSAHRSVHADSKPTDAPKVTYDDHVRPIFREHCFNCHNQNDKRGGLALDTYTALIEGGGSGEIVFDDGDADASRLWQLSNHDDTPVMPPSQPKLAAEKLAVLRAWIEGGILENNGSAAKTKKKNALAFVASSVGKPDGPPPMPGTLNQGVPVISSRASATTAIACSPWAPLIALAGQKQICLYHAESGDLLGILPFEEGIAQSLRFSLNGRYLVAGGGEHSVHGLAVVYDIQTGERVASVGDELDTVFDADANANLSRIAMGGPQKMLRIFDATDSTLLFDIKKHTDWIYAVAFSPDGLLVASGDRSGGLCVWEADTGRLFLDLPEHKGAITSLTWRDDSNVLASASEDGTVKLWDMIAGKSIKTINAHGGGVSAVRFDHQGQLATAGKDRRVRLWDASGNQKLELPPSAEAVLEVGISHDSNQLVHGDWTGRVQVVPIADPKAAKDLAANPPVPSIRLEKVRQTLVAIQSQLAPLVANRDAAASELKLAEQKVAETKAQVDGVKQQLEQSVAKIAQLQSEMKSKADELPALVSKSRDMHDVMIAARVALSQSSDANASQNMALLETQLAEQLLAIVGNRKTQLNLQNEVSKLQNDRPTLENKMVEAQKLLDSATQLIAPAQAKLTAATNAHQTLASQMSEQEKMAQALAAAIE